MELETVLTIILRPITIVIMQHEENRVGVTKRGERNMTICGMGSFYLPAGDVLTEKEARMVMP
jgi:hypothetical protein